MLHAERSLLEQHLSCSLSPQPLLIPTDVVALATTSSAAARLVADSHAFACQESSFCIIGVVLGRRAPRGRGGAHTIWSALLDRRRRNEIGGGGRGMRRKGGRSCTYAVHKPSFKDQDAFDDESSKGAACMRLGRERAHTSAEPSRKRGMHACTTSQEERSAHQPAERDGEHGVQAERGDRQRGGDGNEQKDGARVGVSPGDDAEAALREGGNLVQHILDLERDALHALHARAQAAHQVALQLAVLRAGAVFFWGFLPFSTFFNTFPFCFGVSHLFFIQQLFNWCIYFWALPHTWERVCSCPQAVLADHACLAGLRG